MSAPLAAGEYTFGNPASAAAGIYCFSDWEGVIEELREHIDMGGEIYSGMTLLLDATRLSLQRILGDAESSPRVKMERYRSLLEAVEGELWYNYPEEASPPLPEDLLRCGFFDCPVKLEEVEGMEEFLQELAESVYSTDDGTDWILHVHWINPPPLGVFLRMSVRPSVSEAIQTLWEYADYMASEDHQSGLFVVLKSPWIGLGWTNESVGFEGDLSVDAAWVSPDYPSRGYGGTRPMSVGLCYRLSPQLERMQVDYLSNELEEERKRRRTRKRSEVLYADQAYRELEAAQAFLETEAFYTLDPVEWLSALQDARSDAGLHPLLHEGQKFTFDMEINS